MSSHQTAPSTARAGGIDIAAWALIALIVAAICAAAGWAIARQDMPGGGDLARTADLAGREGLVRGERAGYAQGATAGRNEAALRTRSEILTARREASCDGYNQGYAQGRSRAGDRDAFYDSGSSASCVVSGVGGDILGSGGFGGPDVPGYSSSAFDAYGYGASASSPHVGSTSMNSPGDSFY